MAKYKLNDLLIEDMQIIDLSNHSQWVSQSKGITQKLKTGNRKTASGSVLLLPDDQLNSNSIELSFKPGSVYRTGLVFNYHSQSDFDLFLINRMSSRYKGYRFEIGVLNDGRYTSICEELQNSDPNEFLKFRIDDTGAGLRFFANEHLVFNDKDKGLSPLSKVGLYSQQNNDSVFTELHLVQLQKDLNIVEEKENKQGEVSSYDESGSNSTDSSLNNKINPLLRIQDSKSSVQVEFNEVFTVPLDSFYYDLKDLLEGSSLPGGDSDINVGARLRTLDLRPKRWYRQLRAAEGNLDTLSILRTSKLQKRSLTKNKIEEELKSDTPDHSVIGELEKALIRYNDESQSILYQIENAQDVKALLLREIRTNGYVVKEVTDSRVLETGFDFEIAVPNQGVASSEALDIPDNLDLSNDEEWAEIEMQLRDSLFNGTIREEAINVFETAASELKNAAANNKINYRIRELKTKIEGLKLHLEELDVKKSALVSNMSAHNKLRLMASQTSQNYEPYLEKYYPTDTTTPSGYAKRESAKLHAWLNKFEEIDPYTPVNRAQGVDKARDAAVGFRIRPIARAIGEVKIVETRTTINNVRNGHWNLEENTIIVVHLLEAVGSIKKDFNSRLTIKEPQNGPSEYKMRYSAHSDKYDIREFLRRLQIRLEEERSRLAFKKEKINDEWNKVKLELTAKEESLTEQKTVVLEAERRKFLTFWNDPYNKSIRKLPFEVIYPDLDPLADFLIQLDKLDERTMKTYYFSPSESGYINQHGQSLVDFVDRDYGPLDSSIALFPVLEENGYISEELIKVVKNPQKSQRPSSLPIIKFIETYKITVGWQGYGLGELSHSVNLFPGEIKELVVEKKTQLKRKKEEKSSSSIDSVSEDSSSFEDNLQDTFKQDSEETAKTEDSIKLNRVNSGSEQQAEQNEKTSSFNYKVEAKASWGWGSARASASGGKSSKKTTSNQSSKAFSIAQNNQGSKASSQSQDILMKNVKNTVKKVANKTSLANKVEFTSVSSEDYMSEMTNKEVIKLENPNIGRSVNFNFFQSQNLYGTKVTLSDVKIVINSGQEVIEGTGINDMKLYELEDFGKVFSNTSQSDHDLLVSVIIARQILKNYTDFNSSKTYEKGTLILKDVDDLKKETLDVLGLVSGTLNKNLKRDKIRRKLVQALEKLKGMNFTFNEKVVQQESTIAVNTGSYHLESQVGLEPSTEKYIEERREIETRFKEAELNHLQKQTQAGVFFRKMPEEIKNLSIEE